MGMAIGKKDREEKRSPSDPCTALEALLTEHRLCRPGLDVPHVTDTLVALWCACGARLAAELPPLPASFRDA